MITMVPVLADACNDTEIVHIKYSISNAWDAPLSLKCLFLVHFSGLMKHHRLLWAETIFALNDDNSPADVTQYLRIRVKFPALKKHIFYDCFPF